MFWLRMREGGREGMVYRLEGGNDGIKKGRREGTLGRYKVG